MAQPIIRGIQAVGAVDIKYRYNNADGKLKLPSNVMALGGTTAGLEIDTSEGVNISGFRLDSEFLRAVQQIASSVQIPILGGGAVALTNNNRSGQLSIRSTKVSTPVAGAEGSTPMGSMLSGNGVGPVGNEEAYDIVFLAQAQQAQDGGDSVGATLYVSFSFCGLHTTVIFEGCTVVSVDPLALAGNDAPDYNVVFNYLNWTIDASAANATSALDPWDSGDGDKPAGGAGA